MMPKNPSFVRSSDRTPSPKGRRELQKAVQVLKKGGIVVYPTDTAYGLAVDATNFTAVKKLYQLKGRDFKKPVHVIVLGSWVKKIAKVNKQASVLMKKFWPGPVTIILPLKIQGKSWEILSSGNKTIGMRYPNNSIAIKLVSEFKKPITGTSANISGQSNCYSIAEVKKQFGENIYFNIYSSIYFLDGGRLKKRKPSTVVLLTGKYAKILRSGPISETQIKRALDF